MGYYTDFKLNADVYDDEVPAIVSKLTEVTGYSWGNTLTLWDSKWYDHHHDMIKVSKSFPNVKFILEGSGEENGDVWKKIYLNGKSKIYKPNVVWPEINFNDVI